MHYKIKRIALAALAICFSTGGFLAASIVDPNDSFDHVIITSRQIRDASTDYTLHDLAAHRTANGLRSVVVAVEDIYGNYSGRDDAEKVRHFIIDARDNWGADYFLLGGRPHIVPARVFYMTDTYSFPSDFYYAALEGCFNSNNNDRWGEWPDDNPAQYADVKVGRIPASNAEHVANFVYKAIRYETSPPDASYHSKAVLWTNPDVGNFPARSDNPQHERWMLLHNHAATTVEEERATWAHPWVFDRMSSGNYGLFIGGGHGWSNSSSGLSSSDIDLLLNNDTYFFYTSVSCFSGSFTEDNSFNERLIVGDRHRGAFAAMLNSHYGYPTVSWMLEGFLYSYFTTERSTLGELLNHQRAQLLAPPYFRHFGDYETRWTIYAYNLLGDPATPFRMKFSTGQDASFAFEEASGSQVIDGAGNFEDGTLIGGASRVAGTHGDGIAFDGSSGYIEIADSKWAPMGNQAEVTVMAWINPSTQQGDTGIITKGRTNQSFSMGLAEDGRISFSANSGSTQNGIGSGIWYSNASLPQDEWSHVAVSYDHFHNHLTFYINGAPDRTVNQEMYFGYVPEPLVIGRDFRQSFGYFNGLIDEVRIFSRVLSTNEIRADSPLTVYDFYDGTPQGWTDTATDGQGRQYLALVPPSVSSPNTTPHSGSYFIGLHIPAFGGEPSYTQDSPHDTLVMRSPEFRLNGSGDLTAWLSGGGSGSVSLAGTSVASLPAVSSTDGFLGVALRNVTTGTFVLSASKSGGGNEWEQVTFTEAQLAVLPQNHVYTLDLIDARHGGWGWVNMDTVTIPGTLLDGAIGSEVPVLLIVRSGANEIRLSWPASAAGWTLQSTNDLQIAFTDAGLEVTVEESEHAAYDALDDTSRRFYRLRQTP